MSLFFANPWGLLGLVAVPVIVGIHCLRERSRHVRASTLFLLERVEPTATGGLRLDRLRQSLPLWMQLLAALALVWLLADPRWIRADSRQSVAVVLDSSASMQAFRGPTLEALATRLAAWERSAGRTDWHLLETGPRRPPLYAGSSRVALLAAARDRWRPTLGTHPFTPALTAAASLAPPDVGSIILVTDRPCDTAAHVAVLSVGEPFDNVGISGGDVADDGAKTVWRAIVTNHGAEPAARELVVRSAWAGDGEPLGRPIAVTLAPGQSLTLEGEWPAAGGDRLVLEITPDRFPLDDTLPLVRPVARRVRLWNGLDGPPGELIGRMLLATAAVDSVSDESQADLAVLPGDREPRGAAVLVAVTAGGQTPRSDTVRGPLDTAAAAGVTYDPAVVAAEDHPLTRDLDWGGLLSGPAADVPVTASDEPLLWKGGKPLLILRETVSGGDPARWGDGRRDVLLLAFDPALSTAAESPALVVLLGRFVDRVRRRIARPWAENFQTDQPLDLPDGRQLRTADSPGFFSVPLVAPAPPGGPDDGATTAGTLPHAGPVLEAAAQFADLRESDFRGAGPLDSLSGVRRERALARSVEDPWAALWILLATGALLVAWGWRHGRPWTARAEGVSG